MGKLKDIDTATMFAAGALSAVEGTGMNEEDARNFVGHVCKEAALKRKRVALDDDEEDDDETLWDRTKGFLIPAGVGLGAFLLGSNARSWYGSRPDRGHFENAGNYIWDRIKRLMGVNESELWKSFTRADPYRKQREEMEDILSLEKKNPPFIHRIPRAVYAPVGNSSISLDSPKNTSGDKTEKDNSGKEQSGGQ